MSSETANLKSRPSLLIFNSAALFSFGAERNEGNLGIGSAITGSRSDMLTDVAKAFLSRLLSYTLHHLLLPWLGVLCSFMPPAPQRSCR